LGNFEIGKEADFVVLDMRSTSIMALRNKPIDLEHPPTLAEISDHLFATLIMGDDRAIAATYIMGELVHQQ
jgi:guanine deaminase